MAESPYTPARIRALASTALRMGRSFDAIDLVDIGNYLNRCADIATSEGDLRQQLEAAQARVSALGEQCIDRADLAAQVAEQQGEIVSVREKFHHEHRQREIAEGAADRAATALKAAQAEIDKLRKALVDETTRAEAAISKRIELEHRAKVAETKANEMERRLGAVADELITTKAAGVQDRERAERASFDAEQLRNRTKIAEVRAEHVLAKLTEQRLWYELAVLYFEEVRKYVPRDKQTLIDPMRAAGLGQSDSARLREALPLLRRGGKWASLHAQTVGEPQAEADAALIAAFLETSPCRKS